MIQRRSSNTTRNKTGRAVLASLQSAGRASGAALGGVYARVVEACIPDGQWQEAFRLLEEMEVAGLLVVLPPPAIAAPPAGGDGGGSGGATSAAALPPTAAAADQQTLAAAVSPALDGAGQLLDSPSAAEAAYRAAMGACRRAGAVEQGVFALLDYMDSVAAAAHAGGGDDGVRKSHPSTEIYSLAFATCFEKERWDALPRLLQHMEGHGLKPDGRFFEALVRVLATSPSSSPVARLRQQQREQRRQRRQEGAEEEGEGEGRGIAVGRDEMSTALRKLPWGGEGPLAALSSCSSSLLVLFNTAIHACAAGVRGRGRGAAMWMIVCRGMASSTNQLAGHGV